MNQLLLSVSDTHRALRISRSGLYRLVAAGHLKPIKVASATRFLRSEVEAYVAALAEQRKG